jgi:hypothetical protein
VRDTSEATFASHNGSLAAFAIIVERQSEPMDTSFPSVSVRSVWQLAQLPDPVKSSVDTLVRGKADFTGSTGFSDCGGDSDISEVSFCVHEVIEAMHRMDMLIAKMKVYLRPVIYLTIPSLFFQFP